MTRHRIAIVAADLSGGGQARVASSLANVLAAQGHRVDFLFFVIPGPYPQQVSRQVNVVDLRKGSSLRQACSLAFRPAALGMIFWRILLRKGVATHPHRSIPEILTDIRSFRALVRYLEERPPDVVFSVGDAANMLTLRARQIAGTSTRVVASNHTFLSALLAEHVNKLGRVRTNLALRLFRRSMLLADVIVGVSKESSDNLARAARIPRERIMTIYNPVVFPELTALAKSPPAGPWFRPDSPPVILAAGRFRDQKDFPTLIRAFARVRRDREAQLVILGEGENRASLEALAEAEGVAEDIALPGFLPNPFACMARADAFVLSSKWEALPTVLIEALTCGCPIVSTDCPAGPSEILADGKFGALVPVGDEAALAEAILQTLDHPPQRDRLVERGMHFTEERAAERYTELISGEPAEQA